MRGALKNISLIIALIALVYFSSHYAGIAKSEFLKMLNIPGSSVAGTSTKRAEEISGKISTDIGDQIDIVWGQVLNISLGDTINGVSKLQKIQKDFNSVKDYTEAQIQIFTKKK